LHKEIWKVISCGLYEVSNFGRVRRAKPGIHTYVGKLVIPGVGKTGYLHIGLYRGSGRPNKTTKVAKLVAENFIGPRPRGMEINHKDGNKQNNAVWNLEYVTHKENIRHSIELGLRGVLGEENPNAKLKFSTVVKIRRAVSTGRLSRRAIARKYNTSLGAVQDIVHRRSWATF